ncbi:MAG: DUF488 family protein [Acidimicrobiales bacterium]|nr:DUF488 family protein [Acidimicrobiales bacterium]
MSFHVERAYDDPQPGRYRVLVDRLWPRGVTKERAALDEWCKEVAPSADLRKWYGHVPERFDEFARRYRAELAEAEAPAALDALRAKATEGEVALVTATRDVERSGAEVLRVVLEGTD